MLALESQVALLQRGELGFQLGQTFLEGLDLVQGTTVSGLGPAGFGGVRYSLGWSDCGWRGRRWCCGFFAPTSPL
jgi:hypothetical protein